MDNNFPNQGADSVVLNKESHESVSPLKFWLRVSAPSVLLGALLILVGSFAAFNAHQQQIGSSEWIVREMKELVAIEQLHVYMREIRYQLNMYLRTQDFNHLSNVRKNVVRADDALKQAVLLVVTAEETKNIESVAVGFQHFNVLFDEIETTSKSLRSTEPFPTKFKDSISHLADEVMTTSILMPLESSITANGAAAERVVEQTRESAKLLTIGYVLLGVCGGIAGLFWGIAFARGMYRTMVQLSISVRTVAGQLSDSRPAVTFTRFGDLPELKNNLHLLEGEIARVVEKVQQQELELLRSEQLASVGQLAAGMAHELRNPLMPMKTLVQSALEGEDSKPLSRRALTILNQEISRLETSIQSFLDFARPPALQKEPVDISTLVQDAAELMRPRCEIQNVVLKVQENTAATTCRIDKNQIKQLVLNLLLNAMEAMPTGGTIDVQWETTDSIQAYWNSLQDTQSLGSYVPSPNGDARSPWVVLTVTDSGPGIPSEILAKVFDPFVTSKETGTGLGLSICRRIAQSHHGALFAVNLQPSGARFTLLIPQDAT